MNDNTICDFHNCNEPVCQEDAKLKSGLKFCQEHSSEAVEFVRSGDTVGLVAFWVRSYGGAENLARATR